MEYDAPRHIQHVKHHSLHTLCEMHGFSVVQKTLLPVDSFFNALMSEKLAAQRTDSAAWLNGFRLLRAGVVAKSAFFLGMLSNLFLQPVGSTLLLVLRK